MILNPRYFDLKTDKLIPVDEFVEKVLYHPNVGYYSKKIPFGKKSNSYFLNIFSNLMGCMVNGLKPPSIVTFVIMLRAKGKSK